MRIATFDLGSGRSSGEVIKENEHTVLVKLKKTTKRPEKIIKRHRDKHYVVIEEFKTVSEFIAEQDAVIEEAYNEEE